MSAPAVRPASSGGAEKVQRYHEEKPMVAVYDRRLLRWLWTYIRPHRLILGLSFFALAVQTGLQLIQPLLMGDVVGHAAEKDGAALLRTGAILAALLVLIQILTFVQTYTMQVAGARAMADLRASVFAFYQKLTMRFFDRTPVGRLVTRSTNDVDSVGEIFGSGVLNAVGDLASLFGIVVMMLILDWKLSLIAFASLPLVALIVNYVRKRSREAYRDIRARIARLNAFLNEQVSGISVVQAFSREAEMAAEHDEINAGHRDANKKAIYYEAALDASIEMVGTVCLASILWWAGFQHLGSSSVDFALVVTFTQYVRQFFQPVSLLSNRFTVLQSAMSGAERIYDLMAEEDLVPEDRPASDELAEGSNGAPPAEDEAIALVDVSFSYKPGVPVLQGVNLQAKKGERLALVGATGAGKTTVSSLLLRLYEVDSGTIRVLGKDIRSYPARELRQLFSVVPQDVFLFSGTLLSNIGMTDAVPDREKAKRALETIGALDLFMKREGGLDTRVDERGANLSAGEAQLVAFARAVYRDAPLLILDEATANIDSDTEVRLQRALDAVMEGRTSLVIAHRLSTIRAADRIAVFQKGKVVEEGNHDELIALGGTYAALYRLQFSQEEQGEAAAQPRPVTA